MLALLYSTEMSPSRPRSILTVILLVEFAGRYSPAPSNEEVISYIPHVRLIFSSARPLSSVKTL